MKIRHLGYYKNKIRQTKKHISTSISRKFAPRDTKFNNKIKNLIISPGGVGTTFLMQSVSEFVDINSINDHDGLKHLPKIPPDWMLNKKILFISGNKYDIYASIKRRGWLGNQSAKLGCIICQLTRSKVQKYFFLRAISRQIQTFENYRSENVLVVEYNDIWDNLEEIRTFFGINNDAFITNFPEKRARSNIPKS